ncbi:MAG: tRNA lysidine(34) synthetase TilS [Burkholderiales bacterium]|nr:tRNA lysidine(34) synthetase TilS [Burkholderiales bacterium]
MAVAWSGGRDSTALLHATLAAAVALRAKVFALHVHHGLSPNADAWLAACEAQCARWVKRGLPVTLVSTRIQTLPTPGESVEAWARQARYKALRTMALANGVSVVLLAHHRRDQAETFLLQALRGAGMAGLAGMPASVERDGITWQRPWLTKPREDIDAYVRRHRLKHIDDESNGDRRFARNRLRLDVWPALTGAFGQAETSLATAAEWAHEARAALDELAALDLGPVANERGLQVVPWLALSSARRSNALRAWLVAQTGRPVAASLAGRLLQELPATRSARWPAAGGELRLYRGLLTFGAATLTPATAARARETRLSVTRAGRYALPGWAGRLHVERTSSEGVPLAWLARLELRPRGGAEQFQSGLGRPPRSLKKQFQSAGVPEWGRAGPLLYSGGQLVFVPGLGLDARVLGLPGQPLVHLRWEPLAADAG